MKKNTSKKVLNYAAMSAAILGTANAAGQVVYTDITDEVIDGANAPLFYQVDFNGDNVVDINIGMLNFVGGPGAIAVGSAGPSFTEVFNGNAIAGVAASNFYYPSNITSGTIIGSATPVFTSARGDMYVYACYPNSAWCGEVTDGFIGAYFQVGGDSHYGWLRLDLASNGSGGAGVMTIKDFAFEATPDAPIVAGDTGLSVGENAFQNFTQFVDANKDLNMSAQGIIEDVTIFNIAGQQLINTTINNSRGTVALGNLSNGIYLATVTVDGQRKTFKIAR